MPALLRCSAWSRYWPATSPRGARPVWTRWARSEEHTSELQSLRHLVCRLLLGKKGAGVRQGLPGLPLRGRKAACRDGRGERALPGYRRSHASRGSMRLPHVVFFFNDTATTEIYTLSLHDALPIWNIHTLQRQGGRAIHPQRSPKTGH